MEAASDLVVVCMATAAEAERAQFMTPEKKEEEEESAASHLLPYIHFPWDPADDERERDRDTLDRSP